MGGDPWAIRAHSSGRSLSPLALAWGTLFSGVASTLDKLSRRRKSPLVPRNIWPWESTHSVTWLPFTDTLFFRFRLIRVCRIPCSHYLPMRLQVVHIRIVFRTVTHSLFHSDLNATWVTNTLALQPIWLGFFLRWFTQMLKFDKHARHRHAGLVHAVQTLGCCSRRLGLPASRIVFSESMVS
ncbi:hypothetical protein K438DRAFT_280655 [Mycena galopus ATCC 62051]|nr:hypothetical protein K438DRAFT_280655 [Mycena galopus ATCC 62051]